MNSGTWTLRFVAGSFLQGGDFPDVTASAGVVNIAQVGAGGNLYFYWDDGPAGFIQELVDTKASL